MVNEDLKIEIRPIPSKVEREGNLITVHSGYSILPRLDAVSRKYVTGLSEEDLKYLKEKGCPYDLSTDYKEDAPNLFWEVESRIRLEYSRPISLSPGKDILHFIQWKYILVNPFVYKSQQEMEEGGKIRATHFIYDEDEEIAIKLKHINERETLVMKFGELPLPEKRNIVRTILEQNTDNKNDDYLKVCLNEEILSNKDLYSQLANILNRS